MQVKRLTLCVMLVAGAAGCIKYDERIELNADGSGLVRMHLAVSEQVLQRDQSVKVEKESDLLPVPRVELIRDIEKEGFKVQSLRADSDKGLRHFYLVVAFDKPQTLASSEFFGGRKVTLTHEGPRWSYVQEINVSEKTLTRRAPTPEKTEVLKPVDKPRPKDKPEKDESMIKQLDRRFGKERVRQMFQNYTLSFSVQLTDAGLIRTNGENHHDTAAVWRLPLNMFIDTKPTIHMEADFAAVEPPPETKE